MRFLNTFRGRLLVILAILLMAALGVQYYLNLLTQNENIEIRATQERTIVAAITLAFKSITSGDRIEDLIGQLDEVSKHRVKDIIVINNSWQVVDSLNDDYSPQYGEGDDVVYRDLSSITDLPPLSEGDRLGSDLSHFPNAQSTPDKTAADEAHAIPIDTTSEGRWYVMVLLTNDPGEARWRAARPLVYTLGVLLVSSVITFWLVWRFGQPIANLADAAREVAGGNLCVRVPDDDRNDEMGRLASRFNEMTRELEKKRDLETQLQQAEKSAVVGRLGAAIAHEIRNPLNYINLTLDHLRAKYAPATGDERSAFEKLTGQLKNEVARIDQQISDFLNYSRPTKANLQPVGARRVIEDSLRIVEPEAAEKNVTIGIVEHENVPRIMGDPEFLRSVFNNLFINALQAMEKGGGHLNIKISPSADGNFVEFEIADTGSGISEESLSKIFEPYFSTKETGTGLGLAIVHKIVDIHNGTIKVESVEGEGTKFTVILPKAEE